MSREEIPVNVRLPAGLYADLNRLTFADYKGEKVKVRQLGEVIREMIVIGMKVMELVPPGIEVEDVIVKGLEKIREESKNE